jgi:hypothetical protein
MNNKVPLNKHMVHDVATKYLENHNLRISEEREELIKHQMSKWFFPAKTREIAIDRLTADIWNEWYMISLHGSFYVGELQRLIILINMTDDATTYIDINTELAFLFED